MQIPFIELVETQDVRKVKYKLFGGTPFARVDIDEVMVHNSGSSVTVAAYPVPQTCRSRHPSDSQSETHRDNRLTRERCCHCPTSLGLAAETHRTAGVTNTICCFLRRHEQAAPIHVSHSCILL